MKASPPVPKAAPERRLMAALGRLLGASMGAEAGLGAPAGRPLTHALRILLLFALLWAGVELLVRAMEARSYPSIVSVLAWTGVFVTARAFIARMTTIRLTRTIEQQILPYVSPAFVEAVAADLERRNSAVGRIVWPALAALACWAAGVAAFAYDLENDLASAFASPEIWFAMFVLFVGFLMSARSVGAAGFYISFAERLEEEPSDCLFVLGAASSPLIEGLARLGSQVLVFWVLIFLAILSSMLLLLPWPAPYGLPAESRFLMLFVPLAGFISLGIGSLVYLRSEARIRSALRSFTESQAAVLQQRMNALLAPRSGRVPADGDELARLSAWHDRILAGGRYGSRVGTAVSIALPFLLPAVSFVWSVVERVLTKTG